LYLSLISLLNFVVTKLLVNILLMANHVAQSRQSLATMAFICCRLEPLHCQSSQMLNLLKLDPLCIFKPIQTSSKTTSNCCVHLDGSPSPAACLYNFLYSFQPFFPQAQLHMVRTDVPIDHDRASATYRQLANGSTCSDCSHWLQPYKDTQHWRVNICTHLVCICTHLVC